MGLRGTQSAQSTLSDCGTFRHTADVMPKAGSVRLNDEALAALRPLVEQVGADSQPPVGSTMIFSAVRSRVAYFSIVDGSSSSDTVPWCNAST